jgi:NADH-quinone oxidoreductase subunit N
LRVVVVMYTQPDDRVAISDARQTPVALPATLALAVLTGLVFLLGVSPIIFWDTIVAVTRNLG